MYPPDDWSIKQEDRVKYATIFETLAPVNGKLSGDQAKPVLVNSGLPGNVLGKIWEISDIDKDGFLDVEEMIVALHLVYCALKNEPVPNSLPPSLIPPGKRGIAGMSAVGGVDKTSLTRRISLTGGVAVLPGPPPSGHRSRASSVTSGENFGMIGAMGSDPMSNRNASRSLSGTPTPQVKPPAMWVVDKHRWEPIFHDCDRDHDGLVSGGDVKMVFLQSGLTQSYLAHIWSLCDISQTGTLNLEQFALALHLVEQKKIYNVEPPPSLPPDLIPPSFRPSPAGMTDMGTSTTHVQDVSGSGGSTGGDLFGGLLGSFAGNSVAAQQPSGNKEIDAISRDIDNLQGEKRMLDSSVIQLESDLTVKQSEIKNLEVELGTLDSTVKLLERQKGEAQKRLDDLDTQRMTLQRELEEVRQKLESELREGETIRLELDQSTSSLKQQEEELNRKRQELQRLRDEEAKMEVKVTMGRSSLTQSAQQQTKLEHQIQQVLHNIKLIKGHTVTLQTKLSQLETAIEAGDVTTLQNDPTLLQPQTQLTLKNPATSSLSSGDPTAFAPKSHGYQAGKSAYRSEPDPFPATNDFGAAFGDISDPFKSNDPFATHSNGFDGTDPFAGPDPFKDSGIFPDDPFKTQDPFLSAASPSPYGGTPDPFANQSSFGSSLTAPGSVERPPSRGPPGRPPPPGSSGSAGKKGPPARPAPPKSRPVTPKSPEPLDPWAAPAGTGAASAAEFANFADFSQFG